MILDRMFTLAGALDIIGLLLCVFILVVIVLKAADLRQAVPIVAYFTVLGLGFGSPDEVGPLFQALTASFSYLLILQVAIGRLPAARHLAVLAVPLFGLPAALAAVGTTGVCSVGDACPEFVTFLRVFVVVLGSMVLLLPLMHPGLLERLGSRLRQKWYDGDRYWVVLTLIVFNLFNLGVDLLRTAEVIASSEAMVIRTIFGLPLVSLV
ncbi:MAG: hypothetical protein IIA68_08765, partial [Proteobacteria bacterium]|nr:hypothetical protein [Pseudomonadota bacterium]